MVEIMVVVVLIGVLSALAVPKLVTFTGQSQLDGDANGLYQGVLWARNQSIKSGKRFRLVFSNTVVSGSNRLSWKVHEVDAAGAIIATPLRSGVCGVSVVRGKLSGAPAIATGTASAAAASLSANLGTIDANGMQVGVASTKVCSNTNNTLAESWADGVEFCGGLIGDLETGGIHLYSTRSKSRSYAIVFDRNKSLQPKLLRWMGGKWEVN